MRGEIDLSQKLFRNNTAYPSIHLRGISISIILRTKLLTNITT